MPPTTALPHPLLPRFPLRILYLRSSAKNGFYPASLESTLNCRGAGNLVHRSRFSARLGYGSCYPGTRSRLAGCRPVVCGCKASGSAAGGRRQMEFMNRM